MIDRRHACFAGMAAVALAGCASREPKPPPPPPKPVALLGLLPVLLALDDGEPGFGTRPGPRTAAAPNPVPVVIGNPIATLASIAIGATVKEARDAKQRKAADLRAAVATINWDPAEALDRRLDAALAQRGVRTVRVDAATAGAVRDGKVVELPAGIEALLDVRVGHAGYASSVVTRLFGPELGVEAALRAPTRDAAELDSFSYYADPRTRPADRRWFTTPRAVSFETTDALRADPDAVRTALETVVDRIVDRLAHDVRRHAVGQPRVE